MSLLRESERALTNLEAVADRSSLGMLSWIETDTDLDPVRDDPRYIAMIARARTRLASQDGHRAA